MERKSHQVIDNFLSIESFTILKNFLEDPECPWYYRAAATTKEEDTPFYTHNFFNNHMCSSNLDILKEVFEKLNIAAIIEIRANCILRSSHIIQKGSDWHIDREYNNFKTAILYLHNCDGATYLNKESPIKIESKENRVLIFDGNILHRNDVQTNTKRRIILNMNYYEKY